MRISDTLSSMRTNVVVIVAGNNEPSNSNVLADTFIEGIKSAGDVNVEKIRLKDLNLEHFRLEFYDPVCRSNDDFCDLQEKMKAAHAVVIATPIWNFSVPAHLKNFIDRLGAIALDQEGHSRGQLKAMPFFFIYAGGAPLIAWKALMYITTMSLTEAIKYYDGTVIGRHFEPKCVKGRGKFGLVVDQRPKTLKAMQHKGKRFGSIAMHYAKTGRLPTGKRISHAFFSFLYRVGNRIMYPIASVQ